MQYPMQAACSQGLIYSFGEEDMQLVQPSKNFIFRTLSIGSIGMCMRTRLYVAIFSNTEVSTATMGVANPLL